MQQTQQPKNNFPMIRAQLTSPDVKKMVEARLGKKSGTFITSVLDLISNDKNLAMCDPMLVMREAMKAAGLDLPISKTLGFAYVIPYKNIPSFMMGYKGFIQLAVRTGQYRHINAGEIYEGETIGVNRIKGTLTIGGERTGDGVIGYFAYMELTSGFEKAVAWTREQVFKHAKRFSKSFAKGGDSIWKTDFDAMAKKTMILQLKQYMPMTIDMAEAFSGSDEPEEVAANKGDFIDVLDAEGIPDDRAGRPVVETSSEPGGSPEGKPEPIADTSDEEPGF